MKVIFSIRYVVLAAFVVFLFSFLSLANAQTLGGTYVNLYGSTRTCNTTYQNTNTYWLLVNAGDTTLVTVNSYRSWFMGTTTFTNAGDAGSYNVSANRVALNYYVNTYAYVPPNVYYHFYCGGDTAATYWYERPFYGFSQASSTSTTTQETVINIDLASTTQAINDFRDYLTFPIGLIIFIMSIALFRFIIMPSLKYV